MNDTAYIEEVVSKVITDKRETEIIEIKKDNRDPQKIGEYLSALSNSARLKGEDFGYLIYGIEDNTFNIVGTNFNPHTEKKGGQLLESWLANHLVPRIDFKIHEISKNACKIIVFEIQAAFYQPVKFKGTAYIRVGSSTENLDKFPEKARKIWLSTDKQKFEDVISMHNIDGDKVLELIDYPSFFSMQNLNLPTDKKGILEKLEEMKIIIKMNNKYHITNMGAILFAKDLTKFEYLSRKSIRVIIYKGNNRIETLKEQNGRKGYAIGFEGLINYINDQLPSNEEIGKAFRNEVKMYPEIAIREAVANAIIHQDFSISGAGPMIEIFDNRIEISNPGKSLVDSLRLIDHTPISRNESLASFMRILRICEERGSGVDKIVNLSEEYQLPAPKFEAGDSFMKVTMYAYKKLVDMDKEDKIRACYQHCCLKHISSEYMTNQSLRDRLQVPQRNYSVVSRIMSETFTNGLIKLYDPDNTSKKNTKYIPFWA
ncbi:putative DNA binding domain-containing protein [Staphylococcus sp. EG-SA-6]|nr:putative DNA binding domain-containing protein [Staphylococcus sp. EG-SA-6]